MDAWRVLIVDDHALIRKGLRALLDERPDFAVAGEATDGLEAIAAAQSLMPDVILMDVHMPNCNGIEATRQIVLAAPHIKVIMLTVSDDDQDLFEAVKSGAHGYVLKRQEPEQLYQALESVRRGDPALSPRLVARILAEFQRDDRHDPLQAELSERELEVLALVAEGLSNREIGERLFVTDHTVKLYLHNILDKLHLENRVQAAVYAVRQGLAKKP